MIGKYSQLFVDICEKGGTANDSPDLMSKAIFLYRRISDKREQDANVVHYSTDTSDTSDSEGSRDITDPWGLHWPGFTSRVNPRFSSPANVPLPPSSEGFNTPVSPLISNDGFISPPTNDGSIKGVNVPLPSSPSQSDKSEYSQSIPGSFQEDDANPWDNPGAFFFIFIFLPKFFKLIKNLLPLILFILSLYLKFSNLVLNLIQKSLDKINNLISKIKEMLKFNEVENNNNLNDNKLFNYYHINNFYDYDFPFKYIFKYLNNIPFDSVHEHILLDIKVKSCSFKTITGLKHDYPFYDSINVYSNHLLIQEIPVNLTDEKNNVDLSCYLSKSINDFCIQIDSNKYGTSVDIIFEYKFITKEDFEYYKDFKTFD